MNIRHSAGTYPIVFSQLEVALQELPERSWILTDSNLAALYGARLPKECFVVPAGEGSKSVGKWEEAIHWLADQGAKRGDTVVAFGGGVVGDLAGFVAAAYMRGVRFVQIPTSLLAMVDSSVGGKVGVDLPQGKNLVGAFKPPQGVFVCTELLQTLPGREFQNGIAEILKMALIMDSALVEELESTPLRPNDARLDTIVRTSIRHKASVVERDEFETSGLRATLNYGHTVAHALERVLGYEGLLHGEAVAIGIVVEARIGELLGKTESGTTEFVARLISSHGLPTSIPPHLNPEEIVEAMALDKKSTAAGLAFALITRVGACKLFHSVDPEIVLRALHENRDA